MKKTSLYVRGERLKNVSVAGQTHNFSLPILAGVNGEG